LELSALLRTVNCLVDEKRTIEGNPEHTKNLASDFEYLECLRNLPTQCFALEGGLENSGSRRKDRKTFIDLAWEN
jgi:hypothetical protein